MAVTYKQLINKVLLKLRETQLGASDSIADDDYWELIGSFVNDAKEEVEDAWNWTDLRSVITVTTTASQAELVLTGTNPRTKIIGPLYDTTNNGVIHPVPHVAYDYRTQIGTTPTGNASYYRRRGFSSEEIRVELYPTPDGTHSIAAYCKIPQDELTSEGTTLTLDGAAKAITYRAWSLAIAERGEDGGMGSQMAENLYKQYLTDAIQLDMTNVQDEGHWGIA